MPEGRERPVSLLLSLSLFLLPLLIVGTAYILFPKSESESESELKLKSNSTSLRVREKRSREKSSSTMQAAKPVIKRSINAVATTVASAVKTPSSLLVLSLGNPPEYDGTRHSVGHYVLEKMQARWRATTTRVGRYDASYTQIGECKVWFYRVPGFMNLSGKSVMPFYKEFVRLAGVDVADADKTKTVVLFDELDVALGAVKVRKEGASHRGHNGLRSIQSQSALGKRYTGVQIGIGRNYNGDKNTPGVVANYVLGKFTPEERAVVDDDVVERVMTVVEECVRGKYVYDKVGN